MTPDRRDEAGDLMLAFQRGDEAAFERLVTLVKGDIFALAYRFGLDEARADDVVQETLLRVWRSRATWRPIGPFRAWLLRIASNLVVSEARRVKRARAGALPDGGEGPALADPRAEPPEAPAEREEARQAVERALAELPESQRLALVLNRFHDQSYQEVAEALELSVEAVKSLLFRARQSLKQRREAFMAGEPGRGETSPAAERSKSEGG